MIGYLKIIVWIPIVIAVVYFPVILSANEVDVAVILNKDAPEIGLNRGDIKKIYSGYKTLWNNNEEILTTIVTKSAIHEIFLKK